MIRVTHRAGLGAGLLLLCVAVQILAVVVDTFPARVAVLDLLSVATAVGAAALCGWAAFTSKRGVMQWYWGLFALAIASSAAAGMIFSTYEITLGTRPPSLAFSDVLWLMFYPLALAAVMRLAKLRRDKRLTSAVSLLDALLFAVFGAGLCWEFLMLPVMSTNTSSLATLTNLVLPIGDLLLLGALASLATSIPRQSIPAGTMFVLASFAVTFVADATFSRFESAGTYATGMWIDPTWSLGYVFLAMGAVFYLRGRARGQTIEGEALALVARAGAGVVQVTHRYSAYGAVLLAGILSYDHFVRRGGSGPVGDLVVVVLTTLIPIIVISRQLVLSTENRRLQASLVQASLKLEDRVEERTRELAAEKERLDVLNQAARQISGCTSVPEVLSTGASLLARAKSCACVAVSAPGSRGELQFAATDNTLQTHRRLLQRTLRKFLLSNAANSDNTPVLLRTPPSSRSETENSTPSKSASFAVMMILPIVSRQVMLGAACMASEEADCRLSADEGELVVNIVSQLGVALESVCRYDDARFLADSDALTGLANRRSITDRLDQEIARSERSGSTFAVVMMDVDNFKHFNDRHGHAAGDQVLAVTARALTQALRVGDMVGRFGGDEFVAILPDTDSVGAGYVLDRIEKCLEDRHFHVEPGTELLLRVSCGVAIYPRDGNESQSLLDVADAEMYRSKRQTPDRMSPAPA